MRKVLGALFVAALVGSVAPPSMAASPKLDLVDPAGDSLGAVASFDIVSLSYEVKKLKAKDDPSLVITMKLAAPPETRLARYTAVAQIPDCGVFEATFAPGTVFSTAIETSPSTFFIGCGDPGGTSGDSVLLDTRTDVKGSTITWAIQVTSLPRDVRAGKKLTDIRGYTSLAEPVFGIYGNGSTDTSDEVEGLPNDEVRTDKEFVFV
jgi:hypothetical protein